MKILIIFCSVMITFSGFSNAQSSCKTPDQRDGICIPLHECPHLSKITRNVNKTREQKVFLRQALCRRFDKKPWVCCVEPTFNESDFPQPGRCGAQAKERIIGGEITSLGDYPWLALIKYAKLNWTGFLCGGSIINKDYITTAAHCVSAPMLNGYIPKSVRLGEHDLGKVIDCEDNECAQPVTNVNIGEIIIHEAYQPKSRTQHHDIALIRLEQSVEFTDLIKPICLPFARDLKVVSYDNIHLSIAGFGRTENGSSDVKRKLELYGFSWHFCNEIYEGILDGTQICAGGEDGRDGCNGDSGGPLMRDFKSSPILPVTYLVGIVSRGTRKCGIKGYPAIYTRIDKYLFWIRYQMKP